MRKLLTVLVFLGVLSVVLYALLNRGSDNRSRPGAYNLILVTLDTLRADHLGCYGYSRDTSPALDRFAGRSVVFDSAIVPTPFTAPSHATMLTGLYPAGHGVLTNGYCLVSDQLSLAERLRSVGYRTAAFVGARRVLGRRFGFDQGFEVFGEGEGNQRRAAEVNREFFSWFDTLVAGERFFAWVHYFDVHCDYNAPEPYFDMFQPVGAGGLDPQDKCGKSHYNRMDLTEDDFSSVRAFYDGEIRYVDEQLAGLLQRVREAGLLEETIVVITSDHGESLGEQGLIGHNLCLYDYEVRVPLIIHHPGLDSPPARIGSPVAMVSLTPTLLELLDVAADSPFDGPSLVPLLGGAELPASFGFVSTAPEFGRQQLFCIRSRDRKLILNADGGQEIYSLEGGAEQALPAPEQGSEAAQLRSALGRWILAQEERSRGKDQVVSDEVKEKLKALGYVDQSMP